MRSRRGEDPADEKFRLKCAVPAYTADSQNHPREYRPGGPGRSFAYGEHRYGVPLSSPFLLARLPTRKSLPIHHSL